jgi:hypothetical protein
MWRRCSAEICGQPKAVEQVEIARDCTPTPALSDHPDPPKD